MASNEKIWEKPDPRIKWALDILEPKGYEPTNMINYFFWPGLVSAGTGLSPMFVNLMLKRPLFASIHYTIAGLAAGWCGGVYFRNMVADKNAEEIAILKHYVMLHPERFPEPEKKKFGDKEVFLEWPINR